MGIDRAPCNASSYCHYHVTCQMPSVDCLGGYCNGTYWNGAGSCSETPTSWNSRFYIR